jgi:hypothetical protein
MGLQLRETDWGAHLLQLGQQWVQKLAQRLGQQWERLWVQKLGHQLERLWVQRLGHQWDQKWVHQWDQKLEIQLGLPWMVMQWGLEWSMPH